MREELRKKFNAQSKEISRFAKEDWEKVGVSHGIASYDKEIDTCAKDVLIHADHLMHENKREKKRKNK